MEEVPGVAVAVPHISEHQLKRYYLGHVSDETELASLEEHVLCCHECLDRAERTERAVSTSPSRMQGRWLIGALPDF
jgi:hypothetical protein